MLSGNKLCLSTELDDPVLVILTDHANVRNIKVFEAPIAMQRVRAQAVSGSHCRLPFVAVSRLGTCIIRLWDSEDSVDCTHHIKPSVPRSATSDLAGLISSQSAQN